LQVVKVNTIQPAIFNAVAPINPAETNSQMLMWAKTTHYRHFPEFRPALKQQTKVAE